MTKHPMTKEAQMTKKNRWISRLQAAACGSTFGLRHSFDIRNSKFTANVAGSRSGN
jgi:hypothetical protein